MSLESRITDLAQAIGMDIKDLNQAIALIQAPSKDVTVDGGAAYTVYTVGVPPINGGGAYG